MPEREDWLSRDKMNGIKNILRNCMSEGRDIKELLAWIYDLYQEYVLSDEQEEKLYEFVDPNETFNDVVEYWRDYDGNNLLLMYLR